MSSDRLPKYRKGDFKAGSNIYDVWRQMWVRCVDPDSNRYHNYGEKGISVCDEWRDFQKFASWYSENAVSGWHMDKDILGGRVYSPETCVFVPREVNQMLTDNAVNRGALPIGVYFEKASGKYKAQCSYLVGSEKKSKNLGRYSNPRDAHSAYVEFKSNWIKRQAGLHCISSGMSGKALIGLLEIGNSL